MKHKKVFIILGVAGVALVVFWVVVLTLVVKTLRGRSAEVTEAPVAEVALCDEDDSGLCVVNFGANSLNRMVIQFRLPGEEYAAFYAKARNRDTVGVYTCEVDESDLTAVRCTGVRTPLGETIDLEIYSTDGDELLARGTFLVSAIAISTPISQPTEIPLEPAPTAMLTPPPTPEFTITEMPSLFPENTPTPEILLTPEPVLTDVSTPDPVDSAPPSADSPPSP